MICFYKCVRIEFRLKHDFNTFSQIVKDEVLCIYNFMTKPTKSLA